MQEAEMEGMELEVGWVWACINKLMELKSEQGERKMPAFFWRYKKVTEGEWPKMSFDSDGRQLVFMLLVKTEEFFKKCSERMWNLSGVKVEAASKEAAGVLASDSGVFKHTHSHTTASKKLNNPVKVMFTLLSQATGDMCMSLCLCVSACVLISKPYQYSQCQWLAFNQDFFAAVFIWLKYNYVYILMQGHIIDEWSVFIVVKKRWRGGIWEKLMNCSTENKM